MPDVNFNSKFIDTALLPSVERNPQIIQELGEYFQEGMELFKKTKWREVVILFAHRVFILCVMWHENTKKIFSNLKENSTEVGMLPSEEIRRIPYVFLHIERTDVNRENLIIHAHHEKNLQIGFTDWRSKNYTGVGDEEFQNRGRELIQNILRIGFLEFLTKKRNYLSSDKTKELLLRNIPRMNEKDQEDIAKIVEKIRCNNYE